MNCYIKNKKKMDKSVCLYSVFFWIINFIFMQLSIKMLLKIIVTSKEKWFIDFIQSQLEEDPFFEERTKIIMWTVIAIMLAVMVFSTVTVVIFRNVQLKNELTQMGVLTVIGYNKKLIYKYCMQEPAADLYTTFPISMVCSILIWIFIEKAMDSSVIGIFMNNNIIVDIGSYVLCGVMVLIILMIHTKYFVDSNLKKGIKYMLGKGIV